jgi:hypothetical protein
MRDSDLDRILSNEEEILPSSGFAASVMEAVQREAAAPPPIPFPWKRALPGLCVAAITLVALLTASILLLLHGAPTQPIPRHWRAALNSAAAVSQNLGAAWIILALALSFASVKLATLFASTRLPRYERT